MSSFRNVMKDGWHPKGKDGGKESWRGDFKGINQVAGWLGHSKQPGSGADGGSEHISRPLASLKDPGSFGPPPKNVNYHGGAAQPNQITPHTSGLGAPLSQNQIEPARGTTKSPPAEDQESEPPRPAAPPLPYRADRTGLKTDHLPPPPVHRDVQSSVQETSQTQRHPPSKPKPGPPPKLPARQNSTTSSTPAPVTSPPPPAYAPAVPEPEPAKGILNQSAVNRLAGSGVSVPSLGINAPNPPQSPPAPQTSPQPIAPQSQLSELQARFARMNSRPSSTSPPPAPITHPTTQAPPPAVTSPPPPIQGTSMAEKQAAVQTAANFHRDPSSVSVADAQSAAKTVNNFRERHQEQISAGARRASELNKKYNVTGRINNFLEKHSSPTPSPTGEQTPAQGQPFGTHVSPEMSASIARKPPPPPPPKPTNLHTPPPVPLGTRPSFGQ